MLIIAGFCNFAIFIKMKSRMKVKTIVNLLIALTYIVSPTLIFATNEVETFERKVVVEKGTATWCQYCPRGIIGFRTMYEKYPNNFIGIAMHDDDMYSPSYIYMLWRIDGGLPKAIVNRKHVIDPNETSLKNYYLYEIDKARAGIVMNATWENEAQTNVVIHTTTRFAKDMEGEFRIAYVVTENGVGPYIQYNAYAGVGYDMGGFENEERAVPMLHDHVARSISTLDGEPNSVPENPLSGTDYEHLYTLSLPDNLQNKKNIEVIVLLINQTTGEIENADVKKYHEIVIDDTSGMTNTPTNDHKTNHYYDVTGRLLKERPTKKGIYILQGEKVYVK